MRRAIGHNDELAKLVESHFEEMLIQLKDKENVQDCFDEARTKAQTGESKIFEEVGGGLSAALQGSLQPALSAPRHDLANTTTPEAAPDAAPDAAPEAALEAGAPAAVLPDVDVSSAKAPVLTAEARARARIAGAIAHRRVRRMTAASAGKETSPSAARGAPPDNSERGELELIVLGDDRV